MNDWIRLSWVDAALGDMYFENFPLHDLVAAVFTSASTAYASAVDRVYALEQIANIRL